MPVSDSASLLDRSQKLTDSGIGALRIAAGVFFLIPGLYKLFFPSDFLAMMSKLPGFLHPHIGWLFSLVTFSEIICGILLIIGWNVRMAVVPLVIITIVAESFVVVQDNESNLRLLSLATHVMGVGLYTALVLLGHGRWALGERFSIVKMLSARQRNKGSSFTVWLTSGAAKNTGVLLIRASVAVPFIAAFFLGIFDPAYKEVLFGNGLLRGLFLLLSLLGGIAMLAGFQVKTVGWLLAGLTVLHFFAIGLADTALSEIGLINLLFHLLIIAAVVSLRLINFGSDLEVEHILSQDKRNIVVIGGGFAGTQLVKQLENQLSRDWQVVLVSEENYTTFNPMLAEVVGASVLPSHVIAPIRRMVRRTRFLSARVTRVDMEERKVIFEGEGRNGSIPYEHLVFSFGTRANMDLVPGMKEHAMPFKLLGDALNLRNRVIQQMEKAELETDPEVRRWLGHFVVIGAGFSGVEVGGAIQDFIRASQKHYPRLNDSDLQVTMIHRGEIPLQEMKPSLGTHALESMSKRGIHLMMSTGVLAVDAQGVVTGEGVDDRIDGGTIISTIGTQPNPLIELLPVKTDRGRICVNPDMSVEDSPNIWAIGDCALLKNALDDKFAPPTAQFAIREGRQLADNIARKIDGKPTQPFSYQSRGSMATTGHLNGVAEMFDRVRLGGFPAWLVWRGFYLTLMPTFAKKTRIFFEWTWSMLFSPDIINLRFTTTDEVDRSRRDDKAEVETYS